MSQTRTTGVRFDPTTESRLEEAVKVAAAAGFSRADIIRYSVKIGLTMLEKVKFDLDAIALAGVHALAETEQLPQTKRPKSLSHPHPQNKQRAV